MKYNKNRLTSLDNQDSPATVKYKKKEMIIRRNSPQESFSYRIRNNIDTNILYNNKSQNEGMSMLKSRIYNIFIKEKNQNPEINSYKEKTDFEKASNKMIKSTKRNSQNFLTENNNIKANNNIINSYSPNFSNFDYSLKNNIKISQKDKNRTPLNIYKRKEHQRFNTDKNNYEEEIDLKNEDIFLKDINIKLKKKIPKNNLVICTNNFIKKNKSFSDANQLLNLDEEKKNTHKTENSSDITNDFHNYLKMSSIFSNGHSKKKKIILDTDINNENKIERLRNKMIIDEKGRRYNSFIHKGRISKLRDEAFNQIPNKNKEKFFDDYYYNNTINSIFPKKNLYNEDFDINIDNYYYLPQKPRKTFSNLIVNENRFIYPNKIEFYDYHLKENNKSNRNMYNTNTQKNYTYLGDISKKVLQRKTNTYNNMNYKNNKANTIDISSKENKIRDNLNSNKKVKNKIYIINKSRPTKFYIRKKNKNITNKNIDTLKKSTFEISIDSSKNPKKNKNEDLIINSKNGIYLIEMKNGKPVNEILINDNNIKKINKYLKEEKIMINNSFVELNLMNEINDIKRKYENLQDEINKMKESILIYQKKNEDLLIENQNIKNENEKLKKKNNIDERKTELYKEKINNIKIGNELIEEKKINKEEDNNNINKIYNEENKEIKNENEKELEKNKNIRKKYRRRDVYENKKA